jgi:hypothetical protein
MKSVISLNNNENLWSLMEAQRCLDKATDIFDSIFEDQGSPCDEKCVSDIFFTHITGAEKCIERLVGTVVYNDIFSTIKSATKGD